MWSGCISTRLRHCTYIQGICPFEPYFHDTRSRNRQIVVQTLPQEQLVSVEVRLSPKSLKIVAETEDIAVVRNPDRQCAAFRVQKSAHIPEARQLQPEAVPGSTFVLDAIRLDNVEQTLADHGDHEVPCREDAQRSIGALRLYRRSAVLGALDARFVDQGANLAVIKVKSFGELLFRELVNETWLASPVQVYLDLMRGEGRAREMAKHLRQERLGF